jgi:hypothetical protein
MTKARELRTVESRIFAKKHENSDETFRLLVRVTSPTARFCGFLRKLLRYPTSCTISWRICIVQPDSLPFQALMTDAVRSGCNIAQMI